MVTIKLTNKELKQVLKAIEEKSATFDPRTKTATKWNRTALIIAQQAIAQGAKV